MEKMNAVEPKAAPQSATSHLDGALSQCEMHIQHYWADYPDLYQLVDLRKKNRLAKNSTVISSEQTHQPNERVTAETKAKSIRARPLRGAALRARIRESHQTIRQRVLALDADIVPRIQAHNRKSAFTTIDEERDFRSELVAAQVRAWRSLLPHLIRRFSRIPDPRRANSVKHKLTVLMMYGLFAFIFRLTSRREINRELTSPLIVENLKKLFPEMETIPHADTLARLLERVHPEHIEKIHMGLIKELIKKKKFKKLLINGCLPITIDGTQKLYRDGLLQDSQWCERKVGNPDSDQIQQYIYAIEANITLQNGLTIPLMTEYLTRENNTLIPSDGKQDSETTAFERMAERVKKYFPRQKLVFLTDARYATQQVMGILHENKWEYIIRLPKRKLKDFAKTLNKTKLMSQSIPEQPAYRKRKQEFYWENDIVYGYEWQLTIHLVGCLDRYEEVDRNTGEIVHRFSEHAWISSIRINIDNVHELLNLGARKKELIEDSINTEKNRGYHYKRAFSYNFNAMKGFHLLMRLAHTINAISELSKKLKRYIKAYGCSATLKLIKDTVFSPWLSRDWYAEQLLKPAQLRLQLE